MSTEAATHELGPESATLLVRTGRRGAAAKAGHDLVIEVASWEARLELGPRVSLSLDADPSSLRVREGTGGVQALGDDDKAEIEKTIVEEVLEGHPIEFRSTEVEAGDDGRHWRVRGALKLAGAEHPVELELGLGEGGTLRGAATLKQSDWAMKPYSALFGALKVADEVEVEVEATLPAS